jgi:hypothetical protein
MFQSDMQVDDYADADRREVTPPIEVESATWLLAARSTGGSRNVSSGSVGYAGRTGSRDGSRPLIFVVLHRRERI